MSISIEHKRAAFRALHDQGCFVLAAPRNIRGLRRLEKLGVEAISTTSSAFAWPHGGENFVPGEDEMLPHISQLCAATDLPVHADFDRVVGDDAKHFAAAVRAAIKSGVAGLSVTDRMGDDLASRSFTAERIRAAREVITEMNQDVVLMARCEGFLTDTVKPDAVLSRLHAYASAGADVLCAPGTEDLAVIEAMVDAVAPKAVNLIVRDASIDANVWSNSAYGVSRWGFLSGPMTGQVSSAASQA